MTLFEKRGITDGKWIYDDRFNDIMAEHPEQKGKYEKIAEVWNDENGRLIVQAPTMLDAMITMCIDMETYGNSWGKGIEIIESATGKTWEEVKELRQ